MNTEWLDPTRQDDEFTDVVLRLRHEAAYVFSTRFAEGARVADVACGVAYGAEVLGDRPTAYVGVDRAQEALDMADGTSSDRAYFVCGDAAGNIPLRSGSADLVLAFQILEHIPVEETEKFLADLRRICKPDGHIVITTPNRRHRLLPLQQPWNPYHVREFQRREFKQLLIGHFDEVEVFGLRATEEIERVERERVRQNPIRVYGKPVLALIPESIRRWIGSHLRSLGEANKDMDTEMPDRAERVSVDDFKVEDDPEGRGLDLIALCRP